MMVDHRALALFMMIPSRMDQHLRVHPRRLPRGGAHSGKRLKFPGQDSSLSLLVQDSTLLLTVPRMNL